MLKKENKYKGSSLVVSSVILIMILTIAISMGVVSLKERRASIGESKTNLAIQNAQSGVEAVLEEIKSLGSGALASQIRPAGTSCSGGKIKKTSSPSYEVELLDSDDHRVNCYSSQSITNIVKIKSIGQGSDGQRAIEAGVGEIP